MMGIFNDPFLVSEDLNRLSARFRHMNEETTKGVTTRGAVTKNHEIRLV